MTELQHFSDRSQESVQFKPIRSIGILVGSLIGTTPGVPSLDGRPISDLFHGGCSAQLDVLQDPISRRGVTQSQNLSSEWPLSLDPIRKKLWT